MIDKVLKTSKIGYANTAKTPTETTTLSAHKEREPFSEKYDHATIVIMLLFLSINSRPHINFAMNQCEKFTLCMRIVHATSITYILWY